MMTESPSLYDTSKLLWNADPQPTLIEKIAGIAKEILVFLLIFELFKASTIFALGFVIGVVWDNRVQEAVDKIVRFWNSLNGLDTFKLAFFGIFALPAVRIVVPIMAGLWVGCRMYRKCMQRYAKEKYWS